MTSFRPEVLDEFLADYGQPEDLIGEDSLFKKPKKAPLERALGAELSDHLEYEKGDPAGRGTGGSRNGHSSKTVTSDEGEIDLSVPRGRECSFEPLIVPQNERHLEGFDARAIPSVGPRVG